MTTVRLRRSTQEVPVDLGMPLRSPGRPLPKAALSAPVSSRPAPAAPRGGAAGWGREDRRRRSKQCGKAFAQGEGVKGFTLQCADEFWEIYEKVRTLGRGTFAKVKEVEHRETGERFAAKIMSKDSGRDLEELAREVKNLSVLDHTNIIQLYAAYEAPDVLILITELASGGELMERLGGDQMRVYSEHVVQRHICTILDAVEHMHSRHIVHRDLKPENVLLSDASDEATLKVVDLGLSREFATRRPMRTVCGTHRYLAPEIVECHRGSAAGYDEAVDIWGIGLLAYMMLYGTNPFDKQTQTATHESILACNISFPDSNVSAEAMDFVRQLLCRNPAERPSAGEALKSRWCQMASSVGGADELDDPRGKPLFVSAAVSTVATGHGERIARSVRSKLWETSSMRQVSNAVKSQHRRLSADDLALRTF